VDTLDFAIVRSGVVLVFLEQLMVQEASGFAVVTVSFWRAYYRER
jgi:hypothetical protein